MRRKDSLARLEQHGVAIIPAGWRQSRVKYLGSYMNGYPFKPSDWGTEGRPILRIQDLSGSNAEPNRFDGEIAPRYLIRRGDILISWSASLGVYRWAGEDAWLNQHIFKVEVDRTRLREDFFLWLAEWFIAEMDREVHGSTMQHLTADAFGGFPVLLPPDSQQRAIADYLDRETARIDTLIAAKERVLGLLAEKRRALITRAVTRGLDPHAPLHDSGIPWLGEIPAHWRAERLKFNLHGIQQGWSPQCEAAAAGPEEWGVLKAGCVNVDVFNPEENKRLPDHEAPLSDLEVRPGDVLMSRANTTELLGSAAIVRDVRPRLLLCDKLYRLDVNTVTLLKEFLVYFLRTPSGRFDFERTATGASNSMQNISQDVVRNVWLPVPPLEVQRTIVEHIARETWTLDKVRIATERTIALLKERRAALIAAAVSGQIDVGAAA